MTPQLKNFETIKKFCHIIVSLCDKTRINKEQKIVSACQLLNPTLQQHKHNKLLIFALKRFGQIINNIIKEDAKFLDKLSDLALISLMLTITSQHLKDRQIPKMQRLTLLEGLCQDKDLAKHIIETTDMVFNIEQKKGSVTNKEVVLQLAKKIGAFLGYFNHNEDFDIVDIKGLIKDTNTIPEIGEIVFFFFTELQKNYGWQADDNFESLNENLMREQQEIDVLMHIFIGNNLKLSPQQINEFKTIVFQFIDIASNVQPIEINKQLLN